MTRRELSDMLYRAALPVYGEREARAVASVVLEDMCGLAPLDVAMHPGETVELTDALRDAAARLSEAVPVQYITGKAHFCGMEFAVADGVLIPRPETEELVEWAVGEAPGNASVLDIGTGSGAIAVAMARRVPGAKVTAVDISRQALDIAEANAAANSSKVEFMQLDILDEKEWGVAGQRFDAVLSNPPYIPLAEKAAMHDNVTRYEPHTALFVPDDDPLLFYRTIARFGVKFLSAGGALYFETHENFGGDVARMLESMGYSDVELRKDMNGRDRMVRGRRI